MPEPSPTRLSVGGGPTAGAQPDPLLEHRRLTGREVPELPTERVPCPAVGARLLALAVDRRGVPPDLAPPGGEPVVPRPVAAGLRPVRGPFARRNRVQAASPR